MKKETKIISGTDLFNEMKEAIVASENLASAAEKIIPGYRKVTLISPATDKVDEVYEVELGDPPVVLVLTHEHQYGTSVLPFTVNREISYQDLAEIAEKLDVNFEPEKNEFLSFDSLGTLDEIPHVTLDEEIEASDARV